MKHRLILLVLYAWVAVPAIRLLAQSPACSGTNSATETFQGSTALNYGSLIDAYSSKTRTTMILGDVINGSYYSAQLNGASGFYSRFLLPPLSPAVTASEGNLADRIEIRWSTDPLSSSSEGGFNIYRDGAFLDHVEKDVEIYVDFNVQAGLYYHYQVAGVNGFSEGVKGSSIGFLNPNGVITGQVKTLNGNPVEGASISLSPSSGTSLAFSGDDMAFTDSTMILPTGAWTVSCWVKIDAAGNNKAILDFGRHLKRNCWLYTQDNGPKGIKFGTGDGSATTVTYVFTTHPDDWHHIAGVYSGSSLLLYVDGNLVSSRPAAFAPSRLPLVFGRANHTDAEFFTGHLDEVRVFTRQLSQTEINQYKNRTVNSDAAGLAAYWKFDEGVGSKAYDLSAAHRIAYLCGADWSGNLPDVVNGSVTDESGFYKIDGINYGVGTTFTATPSKEVFMNAALEFNSVNQHHVVLTDSVLLGAQEAAIEIRLQNFENTPAVRTVLTNQSADGTTDYFRLFIENGDLKLKIGTQEKSFGLLGAGYQHLVFNLKRNGGATDVFLYKNGAATSTLQAYQSLAVPTFNQQPWRLGARKTAGGHDQFFSGLIDEVAFYDTTLTTAQIQLHHSTGVDAGNSRLRSYFPLNENKGNQVEDFGPDRTGKGTVNGALWSAITAIAASVMHEFQPNKRFVTLNASNTSADQLDFTDLSTVPVSGVVRFDGTNCFADSVEILVNGVSAVPPIFTNSAGEFVGDFEPGTSIRLSVKYKNHWFSPGFRDIKNLSAPVAGILFRDMTKRTLRGQVAGGDSLCRKSILPAGNKAVVTVATLDGCFTRTIELDGNVNGTGNFVFNNLPPVALSIAVTDHTNPVIDEYFDLLGGIQTNLAERNDTVDFAYFAPPEIEMSSLPTNNCGVVQLEQYERYVLDLRVFEEYAGGVCYLKTAELTINNNLSDRPQYDTLMTNGKFKLAFMAGKPNIVTPYGKTLQVTADVNGQQTTVINTAVVTGERPRATTFASTTPPIPMWVLRDPPGDQSYAYIEKGTSFCRNWSFEREKSLGGGVFAKISLGPKFSISQGIVVAAETEFETIAQIEDQFIYNRTQSTAVSTEVCITTTEYIATSVQEDVIGDQGGDVYMGTALNLLFGITDVLQFDTTTCTFTTDTSIIMHLDSIKTTYVYSEFNILNSVIPNLEAIHDTKSVRAWQKIIADNQAAKEKAIFERNISFDSGVLYEYSSQYDSTSSGSWVFDTSYTNELKASLGAYGGGIGGEIAGIFQMAWTNSRDGDSTKVSSVKVGYLLDDDDSGDYFSINVKKDKKYGTPVFQTVAGASSCPWEPNTQNRDEVALTVDKNVAVNVPANDAAVFKLTLGNTSQSGESQRQYTVQAINSSNPLGALIRINGQSLTFGIPFVLNYGQGVDITLTVERGAAAYDYENLQIAFLVDCEYSRANALEIDTDPRFFKVVELDVHFLEPCSPVDINSPSQDHVIIPSAGSVLPIRLVDYDKYDTDLDSIRTQYRRANSDGTWINIATTLRANLDDVFELINWNTAGLSDGNYEIRAITFCQGGQNPGISHVIRVRIERTPPVLFGLPEPADGVLSPGDEISITFNEDIRCQLLQQADEINKRNIGLYDLITNNLLPATISCLGNKIVVVPTAANAFIEGHLLRMEADSIQDLVGNKFGHAEWEFYVDRSPLDLEGGDLNVTMYEGEEKVVIRSLSNVSGSIAAFEIEGQPIWANIYPNIGSLLPGEETVITYKFAKTLPQGLYRDTIYFNNSQGDERVILNLRVLCPPPDWDFNAAAYPHAMNFTVKLNIEGTLSADEEDIVAAFIDGELRGTAKVRLLPTLPPLGTQYMAFLTVFGDDDDQDEPIDLEIWDASACLRYGEVTEQFDFEVDHVIGTVGSPVTLHTNSRIRRDIPLTTGWNWISFNLLFPNPALNPALASLQHPQNDLLKSQTAFSEYFGSSWVGALSTLNNRSMYQYRADQPDTIQMTGALIDPASLSIPISSGWNWIGYVPNYALPVSEALAGLTPLNGDILRGQTAFAQYLAGFGWLGSLQFMEPPKGYQLKISNAGTLTYPPQPQNRSSWGRLVVGSQEDIHRRSIIVHRSPHWEVDATQFEHSMTLVGMLSAGGQNATLAGHELGAFAGGALRGSAEAIYIEPLNAYLFFLTAFANTSGEQLQFKLYDPASGQVSELNERMYFIADLHQGGIESPLPFTLKTSELTETISEQYLEVQPNPFGDATRILFACGQSQEVRLSVMDATGRVMLSQKIAAVPGLNNFHWSAGAVSTGVYFVRLETDEGTAVRKVVKE